MKTIISLCLAILLSSCFYPVYKQVDNNNKPVTAPITMSVADCKIGMYLDKKMKEDDADCHLFIIIQPLINDIAFSAADFKVSLSAYPTGENCKLLNIKYMLDKNKPGEFGAWIPPVLTPLPDPQNIKVTAGGRYTLVYCFKGAAGHKFKMDASVNLNGKTAATSALFKKFTEVQVFH